MGILDTEKIERLRVAKDLSQEEAATKAGLGGRQKWSDIVTGRRTNITMDTLEGIAKALGVSARDLLKK